MKNFFSNLVLILFICSCTKFKMQEVKKLQEESLEALSPEQEERTQLEKAQDKPDVYIKSKTKVVSTPSGNLLETTMEIPYSEADDFLTHTFLTSKEQVTKQEEDSNAFESSEKQIDISAKIGLITGGAILAGGTLIGIFALKKNQGNKKLDLTLYQEQIAGIKKYQDLKIDKELGRGSQGIVFLATAEDESKKIIKFLNWEGTPFQQLKNIIAKIPPFGFLGLDKAKYETHMARQWKAAFEGTERKISDLDGKILGKKANILVKEFIGGFTLKQIINKQGLISEDQISDLQKMIYDISQKKLWFADLNAANLIWYKGKSGKSKGQWVIIDSKLEKITANKKVALERQVKDMKSKLLPNILGKFDKRPHLYDHINNPKARQQLEELLDAKKIHQKFFLPKKIKP